MFCRAFLPDILAGHSCRAFLQSTMGQVWTFFEYSIRLFLLSQSYIIVPMRKILFVLAFFLYPGLFFGEGKLFDFSLLGGIQAVVNTDGLSSDSSKIVPSPGAVFRLQFSDNMEFSPTVNLYFTRNLYVKGMVLPASLENRMLFTTTFLFDLPVSYVFKTSFADYYIGGGLSFFTRFALGESVLEENEKPLVKKANEFYWSGGRFFMPSLRGEVVFNAFGNLRPGILFRAFLPLYNLWAEPKMPFAHSMEFSAALTVSW